MIGLWGGIADLTARVETQIERNNQGASEVSETAELTEAETERYSWIMGSSPTMWSWWVDVEYHGGDWETPSDITFTVDNPDGGAEPLVKRVTARQIVRALGTAQRTIPAVMGLTHEDLDASSADCVLQLVVLGDVVYA